MKVFADYHHGGLYYSLHLLFEKRLGFELYRPIGTDWLTQGYWRVAEPYGNAPDTVNQYLGINDRQWDAYKSLNGGNYYQDGVYHVYDEAHHFTHKAITYAQFQQMEFDFVVATHPLHGNFSQLLRTQPKARYIAQIGNEGQTTDAVNVLCSTRGFKPKPYQNIQYYHQEFDLSEYFSTPPLSATTINSFVVSLPEPDLYYRYQHALPELSFHAYGVGSPDGSVSESRIPQMMRESGFGYHVKHLDGYGHVIHQWYASGRPVITRKSFYQGKVAEPLLIDGKTCIDLDAHTFEENVRIIRHWTEPENHLRMCANARDIFHAVVNFDKEAEVIKHWLDYLM